MPLILPGNVGSATAATGFNVANSLRFAGAARDTYLTATFGSSPTLATKNTISLWFKRSLIDATQQMYATNNNAANIILNRSGASTGPTAAFYTNSGQLLGPRLYRDTSAWMHFVYTFDSTQGTEANRFKVYINGVEETSFNNTAYPAQEASQLGVNGQEIQIGTRANYDRIFDGYMAETAFVDGQALDATSFGEFDSDSGIWKPINISGLTFGNNGFYLEYKGTGTSANSSGIGADTSGNDLHFAVNAFTAVDQSTDTCTNNFATWNPLACAMQNVGNNVTFSEGNLKAVGTSGGEGTLLSTIAVNSGKWYAEFKMIDVADGNFSQVALLDEEGAVKTNGGTGATISVGNVTVKPNGDLFINGTRSAGWGPTFTDNDIIQIAADLDNGAFYFGKNGTYSNSGNPESGASKTGAAYAFTASSKLWFFAGGLNGTGSAVEANFGSPSFTISSGNTDGNGYGNFEYAVPSGYFALNTKNLAEFG